MISVVVLTLNDEGRIKACLESVKWVDEIVIADNGSTDKTLDIAKRYTDKIVVNHKPDFAERRNQAFKMTKGDWVLFIDSDERILEPLCQEIQEMVSQDKYSAYALSRRNIIFGQEVKYGPFYPDWMIRLVKRSDFESWVGQVHEYLKFKGELGYSKHSLLHLTHRDVDQIVIKSLEWSKIDAQLRLEAKHPPMTKWRFVRIFISELFEQGVRRRGFFHGTVAMMDSLLQTFSLLITYIRLWQLQQKPALEEKYDQIDQKLIESGFKDY